MATAEEGGATTIATSSYGGGGGGAGGKFRKKPFRKTTTPYDRPAIALRGNGSNSGWLTKLVVDPASKLISYGARRFFESVFRKRLPPPPPPPPQAPESTHVLSAGLPEAVTSEPAGDQCSQPIRSSCRNEISDLEQLLKQKTFTRSEIDHLTDLLHSRAGEVSFRDDGKRNKEATFESGPMEANRNQGDRSQRFVSTPISNSKVVGDSIASPPELAQSYMGSRPSNLSPSALDNYSQVPREDNKLHRNMKTASKPVSMSLTMKTTIGSGSPENGYITKPRSFGRSAIYNMSRSGYLKRMGVNHNGYAGLPMPSTSLSIVENSERSEPKSMTLKRRSSVLDDEVGYVSPIRRIRQKSNLIATDRVRRNYDAIQVSSNQMLSLTGDPKHVQRTIEENTNNSIPSTSYAIVSSKSNDPEATVRTMGNLKKHALKDKSSEFKAVGVRQKSPFQLTPSMLHGQALRSMEDATSSELLLNVQDDYKFESNAELLDARDSTPQEQGGVEEISLVETSAPSDTYYPVTNSDSAVPFETSLVRDGTSDDLENGLSPPQNRAAFRMSALEDYIDLDDDLPCNGHAPQPSSEGRLSLESHLTNGKFSPPIGPKVVGTAIHAELESPSDLMLSKTKEFSSAVTGVDSLGEQSNGIITATQPTVPSLSVTVFDKPKEINNPPSPFSSKLADKFPLLMPESSSRTLETKPESSSSLHDVSAPTSSLVEVSELDKGGHLKPLAAEDTSGKSDTISFAASNGLLFSGAPAGLLTVTSSNNNTHQISPTAPVIFTPSTSVSGFTPSGTDSINPATSGGIIFGASEMPKVSEEPTFKFGVSPDPSTQVTAASTSIIPAGDLKNNAVTDPSFGNSISSPTNLALFGIPNSGNMTSGLSSSTSNPSTVNSQGSLFSSASKSFMSAVGSDSQGTSAQLITSAPPPPPSNTNGSSSFVSSQSSSQVSSPVVSFGFNSSASASDTGAVVPSSGSTSSLFGMNPPSVSVGSAGASGTLTTPSIFGFGLSSSSPAINAVGSTSGATAPAFSFGVSSSGSASVTTSSFSSSTSSAIAVGSSGSALTSFGFGLSSSASASVSNAASSFSNGASGGFSFGASSSAPSSAINSVNSNSALSNGFGSSLQAPTSSIFGSSPATGFSFGASATSSASINAAPVVFNSNTTPSSASPFSFSSPSVFSSPSPSLGQAVFGNPAPGFSAASPGNNFQMSAEDSMAEDPVQSNGPSVPVFGQANISPAPSSGFMFGSSAPPQANPFQFGGQQNQGVPQNPSMFQASGSLDFNAGGSFSLGSGAGDKSGRKFVKVNRNKNRKK